MSTGINTYMIRYSDVLLTYVEATMGNSTSTADANAITQFIRVRKRAGLTTPVSSISQDDLLRERRVEFAFEGQFWYDILRLPQATALAKLTSFQRGLYESWCGDGAIIPFPVGAITADKLFFPIPQSEIDSDPKLAQPPVPFY